FCSSGVYTQPLLAWGPPTIAPSGIEFYNNTAIPQWRNSILVAVLKDAKLLQLKLNDAGDQVVEQITFFSGTYGRLRDVCVAPDGRVFIITGTGTDRIIAVTGS
ncbi:MAG: PQQ-dependent sugar dehydrogenase, partial [Sphingobacteriales bacterium]